MNPSRPLRILHLTAASDAGGVSRYVHDLCAAMHSQGHHVTVAGQRGAWHELFAKAAWRWVEAPLNGSAISLWRSVAILKKHLHDHPVDLIHAHYRRSALAARRLGRIFRLPVLFTLHLAPIPMNGLWGWLSDFGDHAHVPSVDAKEWLVRNTKVPAGQITVIPHGIDPTKFPVTDAPARLSARAALGLPADAPVAAYVGRFEDPKNESWALDVAAASRVLLPQLRIILCGSGPNEPVLRQRIEQENLTDRVRVLSYRDPLSIYQAADALLLPSAAEGFSLVCAEAMSTGLPVLRTRTCGTTELIRENITGQSVPLDHDQFVHHAIEMMKDHQRLTPMGQAASKHTRENFTFDQQVERMVALYRSLTGT